MEDVRFMQGMEGYRPIAPISTGEQVALASFDHPKHPWLKVCLTVPKRLMPLSDEQARVFFDAFQKLMQSQL